MNTPDIDDRQKSSVRAGIYQPTPRVKAPDLSAGNCYGDEEPDTWFDDEETARQLCVGCAVIDDCLTYSLANREPFGCWGGKTARERASMIRRAQRVSKAGMVGAS